MKILANKDIRNLFLAVSVIWAASLLLAQGFFMAALSKALFVPAVYFFVGSGGYMGGLLLLFQKAE